MKNYVTVIYEPKSMDDLRAKDAELNKLAGRTSGSSGYGFGQRDAEWGFTTPHEANEFAGKVKELPWIHSVSVGMRL